MTKINKIDYSKLKCPKNNKHVLRKSTAMNFCEVWCDTCKDGWLLKDVTSPENASVDAINAWSKEILASNFGRYTDYPIVYFKITPKLKNLLNQAKAMVGSNSGISVSNIKIPVVSEIKDCLLIEEGGLAFHSDPEDKYSYEAEENVFRNGQVNVNNLAKKLDLSSCAADAFDTSFQKETFYLEVSFTGFRLIQEDEKKSYYTVNTSFIPWKEIN